MIRISFYVDRLMNEVEIRSTLALNIKTLRSRRNWSQADLAEKSGLSIVYLSDIERGNKWPYLDTMIKIANAFKIEVYELLKPESSLPPSTASILNRYSEEASEIIARSFKIAEKNTSQSLAALRDKYLTK